MLHLRISFSQFCPNVNLCQKGKSGFIEKRLKKLIYEKRSLFQLEKK